MNIDLRPIKMTFKDYMRRLPEYLVIYLFFPRKFKQF